MYRYYNANPRGIITNDCVKRAIVLATGMDYREIQRELNRYKKVTGAENFNSDYNPHRYVEQVLGAEKIRLSGIKGMNGVTAAQFCERYTHGRYILNMKDHWSCCINGVIYDTWDCSHERVYCAYEIKDFQPPAHRNCCTDEPVNETESKITLYDGNGQHVERFVPTALVEGYVKCLEDSGYPYVSF